LQISTKKLKENEQSSKLKGVFVSKVIEDGGADKAGMKDGDVILKIGSKEINSVAELQEEIGKRRPGDKVNVTTRDKKGNEEIKEIVLRNSEGETNLMNKEDVVKNVALGAVFAPLTDKEKKELNISYGVQN
jgi:serine protease Do